MNKICLVALFAGLAGWMPCRAENPPAPEAAESTTEQKLSAELQALAVTEQLLLASHAGTWNDPEVKVIRDLYLDLARRFPTKADPHLALSEFFIAIDHKAEAFQQLEFATALEPTRSDLLAGQSDLLVKGGRTVDATLSMENALAKSPKDPALHYALANLYFLFRQDLALARSQAEGTFFDLAMENYRLAAELAPTDENYARSYAETFYSLPSPDWRLALDAWGKTLALSPDKSFVHAHLVRVNIRLKNKVEAARNLDLIVDPRFASLKKALQKQIDRLE